MNFLGHLYFSNNDFSLMQANLFGDFVKGKDFTRFPLKIQEGISLHRKIDTYIDQHPVVIDLLHQLYEPLPKVAGIAVDLFFDHLLAKYWGEFQVMPLQKFSQQFYDSIDISTQYYSQDFQFMLRMMQRYDWLNQYQYLVGLEKASIGLCQRISFPNKLHKAVIVFVSLEPLIEQSFFAFMEEARVFFEID
jgi:acyl carrier protein phosphodiesterase